jgi:hypothetical protein
MNDGRRTAHRSPEKKGQMRGKFEKERESTTRRGDPSFADGAFPGTNGKDRTASSNSVVSRPKRPDIQSE